MHKADFTDNALLRMYHDLIQEDCSPIALSYATIKEIVEAWESYNGPVPAEFYRGNVEKSNDL